MSYSKNVVEDALFQIRNLEETLQENAKGILQSTMSEEIKQLVKESLREQDEIETPPVDDEDVADDEMAMDDDEMAADDDDMAMDDDDMAMDDDDMAMDDDEMAMDDDEMAMGDETIDMTDASDEEVLKVFRAMGDDDGIVVKKEGEYIHLSDDDDDYLIQLGESYGDPDLEEGMDLEKMDLDEWGSSEYEDYEAEMCRRNPGHPDCEREDVSFDEKETIYEIELDDFKAEMDEDMMGMNYADSLEEDDLGMNYADSLEEDDLGMNYADSLEEELYESIKKSITPKGVGIGRGPKFGYSKKPNMSGGFSEKKKEAFGKGTKAVGTGKARFEYKEEKEFGSKKSEYKREEVGGVKKKAGEGKDGHYKDFEGKFGGNKGDNSKAHKGKDYEKMETKESSRTLGAGKYWGKPGLPKPKAAPSQLRKESVNGEVNLLREKNEEYKIALDVFRTKLNEVAVFNSNLAYATRLFTEHSTTKQEKINILRRFDNIESLKESKNLYRSIKGELSSNGSVGEQKLTESIERTVNKTPESGSAVNLIESKTYENPQFLRMKDLMSKM